MGGRRFGGRALGVGRGRLGMLGRVRGGGGTIERVGRADDMSIRHSLIE